ncbi:MAG: hypothetical protein ACJ8KF_15595 [Chthoniobacterales bacterium]
MLLNEFLKEHHKVEEQAVAIAQQRKDFETKISKLEAIAAQQGKQIQVLTAGIQKVSAELQLSKPAPTTVVESP